MSSYFRDLHRALRNLHFAHLSLVYSFIIPEEGDVFENIIPGSTYGIYINSQNNFIVFMDDRIHWLDGVILQSIFFKSTKGVDIYWDDEPQLELTLQDDSVVHIPVLNETEEVSDIYAVRDYIFAMVHYPHFSSNAEDISAIESREDLVKFLSDEPKDWPGFSGIAGAIKFGFPQKWQLQAFGIDESVLENPDVWRLLALFICREMEEKWEDNTAEFREKTPTLRQIEKWLKVCPTKVARHQSFRGV